MTTRRSGTIPKDVFIRFDDIAEDPFEPEGNPAGKRLIQMVCGAMNINKNRCGYAYYPEEQAVVLMFHFDRGGWATKAAERAASIIGAEVSVSESEPEDKAS